MRRHHKSFEWRYAQFRDSMRLAKDIDGLKGGRHLLLLLIKDYPTNSVLKHDLELVEALIQMEYERILDGTKANG